MKNAAVHFFGVAPLHVDVEPPGIAPLSQPPLIHSHFSQSLFVRLVIAGLLLMPNALLAVADTTLKTFAVPVTTALAQSVNWAVSIPAQGEILPWEVAVLSAKSDGIAATEVAVVEGDVVHKGQILARFDDRLLRAELARAQAEFALATANYQLTAANLKRFDQLRAKQTVSEQEYELVSNQAAIAAALRDQAAAALNSADIKLVDAVVIATDSGKILERNLELGQIPQKGHVLFRLLRQQKLEWVAKIDAAELTQVQPAMAAQVTLQHLSSPSGRHIINGNIRSVSPQLNSSSRLATVRVLLDGSPEVAVNTYADGKILVGNNTAIIVPANCLVIKDGKAWLFRINNHSAEQVLVTVGRRQQDAIEITSGISAGDIVVQEGAGFLNHGDTISITNATPNTGARQ